MLMAVSCLFVWKNAWDPFEINAERAVFEFQFALWQTGGLMNF